MGKARCVCRCHLSCCRRSCSTLLLTSWARRSVRGCVFPPPNPCLLSFCHSSTCRLWHWHYYVSFSHSSRVRCEVSPGSGWEDLFIAVHSQTHLPPYRPQPLPVWREQCPHYPGLSTAGFSWPQIITCLGSLESTPNVTWMYLYYPTTVITDLWGMFRPPWKYYVDM